MFNPADFFIDLVEDGGDVTGLFDAVMQASEKGDQNKVLFVHFTGQQDYPVLTGGVKHVKFWKIKGALDYMIESKHGFTGKEMERLLGHLISCFLLRREMLALLQVLPRDLTGGPARRGAARADHSRRARAHGFL